MKISKIVTKVALGALMMVSANLAPAQAMDPDLQTIHTPHRLKALCMEARAVPNRFENPIMAIANGAYNEIGTSIKTNWKEKIKTLAETHVGNPLPATNILTAAAAVGVGGNNPANRTLGAFLAGVNAEIDGVAPAQGGLAIPSANRAARLSIPKLNEVYGHFEGPLTVALTAWLEALGANANDNILEAGVGLGAPGQPANDQRNTFRDFVLAALQR